MSNHSGSANDDDPLGGCLLTWIALGALVLVLGLALMAAGALS